MPEDLHSFDRQEEPPRFSLELRHRSVAIPSRGELRL